MSGLEVRNSLASQRIHTAETLGTLQASGVVNDQPYAGKVTVLGKSDVWEASVRGAGDINHQHEQLLADPGHGPVRAGPRSHDEWLTSSASSRMPRFMNRHPPKVARIHAKPRSRLCSGDPAGTRLILVHGTPGTAASWANDMLAPPPGMEVVALDRPGFGLSGPPQALPKLADQAAAVHALLPQDGRPVVLQRRNHFLPWNSESEVRTAIDLASAEALA